MKKITTFFKIIIIPMMLLSHYVSAQTITKETPSVLSGTVCPKSATSYRVSIPSNFGSCKIKWTVTNGSISGLDNQPTVSVAWNDTPGATATITVTFSGCATDNPNEGETTSKSELILSVKNQAWGSYGNSVNIDYCTKATVNLTVPRMFVLGTGGIAQPLLTEVGYAWTLPNGWREVGTNRTGFFGTTTNFIAIEPIDCAKPGLVTVYGTLAGGGPFCNSAEKSATATISLNGANPVATVGPQSGYAGGSACNDAPVTFYASTSVALGCISGYNWTYPPSWSLISQSANSITLRPSGTAADSDPTKPIKATITFACGSSVTGNYIPPFNKPAIEAPYAICYGGTPVTLLNVAPSTNVIWNPGANMVINSGQGTPSIVIRGTSESIRQFGKINATITCADVSVPEKTVWVGKAKMVAKLDNNQLITHSSTYNEVCNYISYKTVMDVTGSTFNTWSRIAANPTNTSWYQAGNDITFYFWAVGQTATYRLTSGNNCGSTNYDFRFRSISCSSNPCSSFTVSPNPSNTELNIIAPNIPAPCDELIMTTSSEGELNDEEIQSITLISLDGQIVRSEQFPAGTKDAKIDLSGLRKGIYILKVSNGKKIESHRVQIKE